MLPFTLPEGHWESWERGFRRIGATVYFTFRALGQSC